MSEIINYRRGKNPSSGEINFVVENKQAAMRDVENVFAGDSEKTHFFDGLTCEYQDWRFNLRQSHTENFLRLNVESKQNLELLREKVKALQDVICRH
jgi:phosphomannomutase